VISTVSRSQNTVEAALAVPRSRRFLDEGRPTYKPTGISLADSTRFPKRGSNRCAHRAIWRRVEAVDGFRDEGNIGAEAAGEPKTRNSLLPCRGARHLRRAGKAVASAAVRVFTPVADARVTSATPNANFGRALRLSADASPCIRSFLRFEVTGLRSRVARASLRVFVDARSRRGFRVFRVDRAPRIAARSSREYKPAEAGEHCQLRAPFARSALDLIRESVGMRAHDVAGS
jgi:hypothetical protein